MTKSDKYYVGDVCPSQLLQTYGVGAIIDLPHLSALIMGLDEWDTTKTEEVPEERLLRAVQSVLGSQVKQLLSPPAGEAVQHPFDPAAKIGVPVAAFPRWLVCPRCHLLAPVESGLFQLKPNQFQPDRTCYRHHICTKQPIALPSRFMIACEAGHLDDFPFKHFLHGDAHCNGDLRMIEVGVTGEPSDIVIKCSCGKQRPMAEAFTSDEERVYYPVCRGRRPHLRDFEKKPCPHQARTILLAASNTWFPLVFSSLSLPTAVDALGQLVELHWTTLEAAESAAEIAVYRKLPQLKEYVSDYSNEEIWQKVEQKKRGEQNAEPARPGDLKTPEWEVLSNPASVPTTEDFEVSVAPLPEGYEQTIQQVVLVQRLREVRALTGFTRIESLSDYAEEEKLPADHIMRLSRSEPRWVPAAEVRGEGLFLQFREEAVQHWQEQHARRQHNALFRDAHYRWRKARNIAMPEANYPGLRYVLLHTFAHALMRQLSLECGYAAASIRERIYAKDPEDEDGPMAGILLYTAAADSEGTLGGLVYQGKELGYHIGGALEEMERCASDPLCAEHIRLEDGTLHGAACHACLFMPETSCERGNRYLDRSLLVRTIEQDALAFFSHEESQR